MKKQTFALMLSTILCSAYPVIAMDVDLESTNVPVNFTKNLGNTYEVTTDDNADANYQAVSKKFSVVPGQTITVDYDVEVIQGVMSFGLLATSCTAWYEPEVVLNAGKYTDSFTRVVPENETETNLVLRNYHLGVGGQTTFKLNKLQMEIKTPITITETKDSKLSIPVISSDSSSSEDHTTSPVLLKPVKKSSSSSSSEDLMLKTKSPVKVSKSSSSSDSSSSDEEAKRENLRKIEAEKKAEEEKQKIIQEEARRKAEAEHKAKVEEEKKAKAKAEAEKKSNPNPNAGRGRGTKKKRGRGGK